MNTINAQRLFDGILYASPMLAIGLALLVVALWAPRGR